MEPLVIFAAVMVIYCFQIALLEEMRDWQSSRAVKPLLSLPRCALPCRVLSFQPLVREWRKRMLPNTAKLHGHYVQCVRVKNANQL